VNSLCSSRIFISSKKIKILFLSLLFFYSPSGFSQEARLPAPLTDIETVAPINSPRPQITQRPGAPPASGSNSGGGGSASCTQGAPSASNNPTTVAVANAAEAAKMKMCDSAKQLANAGTVTYAPLKQAQEKAKAAAESCATAMSAASTACVDSSVNPIASEVMGMGMQMTQMMTMMGGSRDKCAKASSMLPMLNNLLMGWQAACGAAKATASSTCGSVATAAAEVEKHAINVNTWCDSEPYEARLMGVTCPADGASAKSMLTASKQLAADGAKSVAAVGGYEKVVRNLATGGMTMAMQGQSAGECGEDFKGFGNANPSAQKYNTDCALNPRLCDPGKDGFSPGPIGAGEGSSSDDGNPNFSASDGEGDMKLNPGGSPSGGGGGAPGGGGGGLGGGGGGGAAGKVADGKKAKDSGAVNSGDYGGGGGSRRVGEGWADGANAKTIAKLGLEKVATPKREPALTGSGGKSNFEKVRANFKDVSGKTLNVRPED
jgi:hypothetical protein